ncbi:hypothetical protein [Pseudomonas putida]|uniref:hypothetical protein n=1 Tax=Pseudomonas putida TaxID=303 RepID=UPI0012DB5436|nr:hypothetical protein [Pseudomonas putida]
MSERPSNKLIGQVLKVAEKDIELWLVNATPMARPNVWLLDFSYDMPWDLRKKLKMKATSLITAIPPER